VACLRGSTTTSHNRVSGRADARSSSSAPRTVGSSKTGRWMPAASWESPSRDLPSGCCVAVGCCRHPQHALRAELFTSSADDGRGPRPALRGVLPCDRRRRRRRPRNAGRFTRRAWKPEAPSRVAVLAGVDLPRALRLRTSMTTLLRCRGRLRARARRPSRAPLRHHSFLCARAVGHGRDSPVERVRCSQRAAASLQARDPRHRSLASIAAGEVPHCRWFHRLHVRCRRSPFGPRGCDARVGPPGNATDEARCPGARWACRSR